VRTAFAAEPAADLDPLPALADDDLRLLLLIRYFELKLLDLFSQGALNGTTHTCTGQEYVPVALRTLLGAADFVFSNHRGHGHYLARFEDPQGLLAEIMGRAGAVCRGVGGSQHILRERYLSTGVQGQSLPVAAGTALHLKRHEPGALTCVYIGDGTWGEGAVYEALNMAALWRLPLLVVVEHNGIAQTTPTAVQMAGTIAGRAAAFGIRHRQVRSVHVGTIRDELGPYVAAVRSGGGPLIAEFETYRVGPHSKGDDTRPPEVIQRAKEGDWLRRYAAAHPAHLKRWEASMRDLVESVAAEVAGRPLVDGDGWCG
jgi:acetoin:2,6-dichlorophenolindophenol oxidoreductase subunit alpha